MENHWELHSRLEQLAYKTGADEKDKLEDSYKIEAEIEGLDRGGGVRNGRGSGRKNVSSLSTP